MRTSGTVIFTGHGYHSIGNYGIGIVVIDACSDNHEKRLFISSLSHSVVVFVLSTYFFFAGWFDDVEPSCLSPCTTRTTELCLFFVVSHLLRVKSIEYDTCRSIRMSLPLVLPLAPDSDDEVARLAKFFNETLGFRPNSVLTMQHRPAIATAFIQLNKRQ